MTVRNRSRVWSQDSTVVRSSGGEGADVGFAFADEFVDLLDLPAQQLQVRRAQGARGEHAAVGAFQRGELLPLPGA